MGTFEAKKMIVNCTIRRAKVFRDYKLNADLNYDPNPVLHRLDISVCHAVKLGGVQAVHRNGYIQPFGDGVKVLLIGL